MLKQLSFEPVCLNNIFIGLLHVKIILAIILAFSTAKGELVRSILYPKPVDFKFNTDTYKYVGGMACIALGGMIFSIVQRVCCSDFIFKIFLKFNL